MAASAARVKVSMLGTFAVEYEGRPVAPSAWKRKRPVHLLTALALAPGYVLHREELIDRLWPDKDLDAGANNLYRTLHDLRRIAGDDIVRVERGAVRLDDGAWVDVTAFEEAASAGAPARWLEAIELYQGDLLPDDPYSELVQPRRQGLRQRFVDTALRLARLDGELALDRRIEVLRRLLEVEPALEEGHRLLIAALGEAGRPQDATRQLAACVEALREHLDAAPGPETLALYERVKRGELAPARTVALRDDNWAHVARRLLGTEQPRPVRGRSAELAQAVEFAGSAGGALLIVGEAGAGKTRLAVECARACAERGAVILAGLGYDFEGTAPYTPFVDAWNDVLRVFPSGTNPFTSFAPTPGGSAQEDRLRLFQSVERSIAELAGGDSACIVIEDIHQADESSLHLFHHLARASRHLPLKLIGTLRAEEVRVGNPLHVLMASLGRERMTARINLDRLDLDGTRELLRDVCGEEPDPAVVRDVYRLAGGNPFYTEELAAGGADLAPSADLTQTIRARVAALGADAERLLVTASVQGARFDFEIARAAVGMDPEPALDALEAAVAARVVEEHEHLYRFRHALMREALYGSISTARRVYLHRATAEALEQREPALRAREPEVLAFHHHAAGNLRQALPHTLEAIAHAQSRLGFGEAVTHSLRALELMDSIGIASSPERFAVMRDLGAMRVALGDLDNAVADLDAAAALGGAWRPSPAQRCNALRLAGLALIESGDLTDAERHLDDALAALGDDQDPGELGNIYYLYAQLRWHQSRHDEAFALAEKCLNVAERAGDAEAIAKGYEMLALACHSLGEWKQGRAYEAQRRSVTDGTLDVASAFDVHL